MARTALIFKGISAETLKPVDKSSRQAREELQVGDIVLTSEESHGLMTNRLVSHNPSTGIDVLFTTADFA